MVITSGALMGQTYAPSPAMATLTVASQLLGVVISLKYIAILIDRYGMKRAFNIGVLIGLLGGLCLAVSVYLQSFLLICISLAITGVQVATASYYRFAAADIVPTEYKPRAVSIVIFGAIAAAFIGPTLSVHGRYWDESHEFLGIGLWYAILMFFHLGVLAFTVIKPVELVKEQVDVAVRSIKELMQDSRFVVGMVTTTVSYALMTLIMNATPLEMEQDHLSFNQTATVIQWHVVGMFLPSLFSGFIIERFGYSKVLKAGCLLLLTCNIALLTNTIFSHFLVGNILLGFGWNFLLVGGTAMLAQVYSAEERAKTQYFNNLVVYITNFFAAALAGSMHSTVGWMWINIASIIVIIATFILIQRRVSAL